MRPTITAILKGAAEKLAAIGNVVAPRVGVNGTCTGSVPSARHPGKFERCTRTSRRAETDTDFKIACKQCKQWKCNTCTNEPRIARGSALLAPSDAYPRETWWDVADGETDSGDDEDE